MSQIVIENPILNPPFTAPSRHFRFSDEGITEEIVEGRRVSSYFIPIAQPRKRRGKAREETEWTKDRIKENEFVNQVRSRVSLWRERGYPDITKTTRRLLEHWRDAGRMRFEGRPGVVAIFAQQELGKIRRSVHVRKASFPITPRLFHKLRHGYRDPV